MVEYDSIEGKTLKKELKKKFLPQQKQELKSKIQTLVDEEVAKLINGGYLIDQLKEKMDKMTQEHIQHKVQNNVRSTVSVEQKQRTTTRKNIFGKKNEIKSIESPKKELGNLDFKLLQKKEVVEPS